MPLKWRPVGKWPLQSCVIGASNTRYSPGNTEPAPASALISGPTLSKSSVLPKNWFPRVNMPLYIQLQKDHSFIPLSAFSFLLGLGFTELHKPTNYRSMYLILLLMLYSGSNSMLNDTPLLRGENLCLFPSVTKKWLMVHWAHRFSLIVSVTFQREAAGASEIKKPLWKCLNKPVVWWSKLSPGSPSAWAWPGS